MMVYDVNLYNDIYLKKYNKWILGHLNLILAIEENLKVKFNSVDILKMQSIKEIVKILVNNN